VYRPTMRTGISVAVTAVALAGTALAATSWADTLAARALSEGPAARLPPNLCAVLKLTTNGQGLAVRQLVVRDGLTVRNFNVGADAPHRVVVIVADEAAHLTTAYAVTPRGHLRRAVEYHTGEAPQDLPAAQAKAGFDAEVRFWSQAAATAPAR
jgi:hypothetical protein